MKVIELCGKGIEMSVIMIKGCRCEGKAERLAEISERMREPAEVEEEKRMVYQSVISNHLSTDDAVRVLTTLGLLSAHGIDIKPWILGLARCAPTNSTPED